MSLAKVKANTKNIKENCTFVDPFSKTIIIISAIFGINRTFLIFEKSPIKKNMVALYTFVVLISVIAVAAGGLRYYFYSELVQYVFCIINSVMSYERLKNYLAEINNFDKEVGRRPQMTYIISKNIGLYTIMATVMISTFILLILQVESWSNYNTTDTGRLYLMVTIRLSFVLEMFFVSHLLCLICPRIRLINYYMESALSHSHYIDVTNIRHGFQRFKREGPRKDHSDIKYLMDLYMIIVSAYRHLINAIKWQFLVSLLTSFVMNIILSYLISSTLLGRNIPSYPGDWGTTKFMFNLFGNIVSLFGPSMYGDQLHADVERLRMNLAFRLYKEKMDKSSRSAARALLALTQQHDLSLSLLGMVKVDISLPLKYISLLLTYLIILLQFQKVKQTDD